MFICRSGSSPACSLYRGTCKRCGCEVLVREQEVIERSWEHFDGFTTYERYTTCPTLLCGGQIELTYDRSVDREKYDKLVAQYGPEV